MRAISAISGRSKRTAVLVFAVLIGLALVGWAAARQIRSPAQIAADTAPPKPSAITVPVVRRTLSTEVIVRGTVRYGDPQAVVLGVSKLKQASGTNSSDIVTRPPRRGLRLAAGHVAMTVDGRPVFVLPGAIPMHRDLRPGDHGPDVRQLERALKKLGFNPGAIDGHYDSATAGAVSAFYLHRGWDPFGATDTQLDQLRTAESAAATARDAYLQTVNTLVQTHPTDVNQARNDAVTARDALNTAVLAVSSAKEKLDTARSAASTAGGAVATALATSRRDRATADADVNGKRAAFKAALDDQEIARTKLGEVPRDAPASDQIAAGAAMRQAQDAVKRTQAELNASIATAQSVRADAKAAVTKARSDAAQARRDVHAAAVELRRARLGVSTARQQARITRQKVLLLTSRADEGTLRAISDSARREARRTQAVVDHLSRQAGVQVPANELLFFRSLPVRVDTVKAKRGSAVTGPVMKVTNSRLAVDSSLDVSDAKLVRAGDPVAIEEQDLGVRARGRVSQVADAPGTNRVDPSRFYFAVVPEVGFPQLVGTSVKLTISVKSTKGKVLAVPPSALSIGGDGNSRLQVLRGGRTVTVTVVPGLAAEGLVEVKPERGQELRAGDLVIVGSTETPSGGRTP